MATETDALPAAIRAHLDPVVSMNRVVEQALQLVAAADGVVVELLDDDGFLTYVCAAGSLAPHVGTRLDGAGSMSGAAIARCATLRSDDTDIDPRVDRDACRRVGVRSMICVPLVGRTHALGVLKVGSARPGAFGPADEATLSDLADFVATLIEATASLARVTNRFLVEHDATGERRSFATTSTSAFVANVLDPGLAETVDSRERFRALIDEQLFTVVYQPIVDLRTGRTVAVEALARFPGRPGRGPDWWFAEAHRLGVGVELELAAVEVALDSLRALPAHCYMAINVGPATISHPRLHDLVGPHGRRVVIELTEHERVVDHATLVAATARLRADGVRLAIDDTGAGYAGLAQILRLRPDVVKLDRTLTLGIETDRTRQILGSGLLTLASDLGAVVVAEGVENDLQMAMLHDLGFALAQGFHIARPDVIGAVAAFYSVTPGRSTASPGPVASAAVPAH